MASRQATLAGFATAAVAAALLMPPGLRAVGPTFTPDATFRGSQLTGWRPLGGASWSARDGVITGTAAPDGDGGWLWSDRAYQDIGVYLSFRCPANCTAGVLLRTERPTTSIATARSTSSPPPTAEPSSSGDGSPKP